MLMGTKRTSWAAANPAGKLQVESVMILIVMKSPSFWTFAYKTPQQGEGYAS
jgi:hypothetical protein